MAVSKLPVRSCLIDGEAIVCDENGLADFELIRRHGALASAALCAFDLLELDGRDLRREPIEGRKRLLAKLLKGQQVSIVLNEHYEGDGENGSAASGRCAGDDHQTTRARVVSAPPT
jgi:bifunctional non-homologous end joining protein LigD